MAIKIEDYFQPIKEDVDISIEKKIDVKDYFTPTKDTLKIKAVEGIAIDDYFTPIGDIRINTEDDVFSKMNKFQKTLDLLGRPGYAIKSAINEMQDQQVRQMVEVGLNPDSFIDRQKWIPSKRLDYKKVLKVAWGGLTGKERITANDLWKNVGVEGVPFLGFATEIALDPLQWGGSFGYKAIGKGAIFPIKTGLAGAKKIPGVAPLTIKAVQKVKPAATALKEMFITKTGLKSLDDLISKHLLKREYLKGKELRFGTKTRNVLQNIAKKTGKSIDDVEKQIVNLIENPTVIPRGVPQESIALSNTIKSRLTNILTAEMKAGVPITALSKNVRSIQYFPRITTKEAQKYLKQAQIGTAKIWNPKIANALQRRTGDFTLQEFNEFVASQGLKSLGGRSIEQYFMQSPAYAVATRGIRSAKAVTSAQFLDDVGKTYGLKKAPMFWQELPDTVTKLNPSLKGLKFDPEVMGEITRTTKKYINPQESGIFMKTFDTIQNTWKKWTLAPFPKYHLRNMVGNLWNNHLAGVSPTNYPKAQAIQMYRKYKTVGGVKKGVVSKYKQQMRSWSIAELKKLGITPQQADDIILNAEKTGVLGTGWFGGDIETAISREITGKAGSALEGVLELGAPGRYITKKGMAFGSAVENNARLAHFIDKIGKGDDAMTAAKSVKKFLFDYGDLTSFEKQVMKRIFPFYTWTRKNIPLQFEQLVQQPQKYAPLTHLLRSRDPKDLMRLKYARPDLYERLPMEMKRTADTVTYIPLEGLLPAGDLIKMVRPQEIFIELLTPYLRAPIEASINKSFYFESEIQKYSGETQELLRIDMPVKLKYALTTVLPQARLLNEINKIIRKQVRKEELTTAEQVISQTLSSIYKVNLKDLRQRALFRLSQQMTELNRGMFWAKRNARPAEVERIKKRYKEIKEEMKKIKR